MADYIHEEYPKVKYNPNGGVELVDDARGEKELGAGWVDNPKEYGVETAPAAPRGLATAQLIPGYVAPPSTAVPAAQPTPAGAGPEAQRAGAAGRRSGSE